MDNFLGKIFDFFSYGQKSLIVTSVVVTPVVYSCFYVFMDNFGCYPIFERLMFTGAAIIIWLGLCYVLGMVIYLVKGDEIRRDYEFRIRTPEDYDKVFSGLFISLCFVVFAVIFVIPLLFRIVFCMFVTQSSVLIYIGTILIVEFVIVIIIFLFLFFK